MGSVVPFFTRQALAELGIADELESGPVAPREERLREVRERAIA
jgi:hypothetical protein